MLINRGMMDQQTQMAILMNCDLRQDNAPSISLVNFLKFFPDLSPFDTDVIIGGNSVDVPDEIARKHNLFFIRTGFYSIKDSIFYSVKTLVKLVKNNRDTPYDVLYCIRPNSSLLAAVLFKFLSNNKVKIVYEVRSRWIDVLFQRNHLKFFKGLLVKFLYWVERLLLKQVDLFITHNNELLAFYNTLSCRLSNRSAIIPSGVDVDLFSYRESSVRSMYGIDESEYLFGIVSSLNKDRDFGFILKSIERLRSLNYPVKLMFVGSGDSELILKDQAESLGLRDSVFFTGRVAHNEVVNYISSFDVGIAHLPPSDANNSFFPQKILEYSAVGIPILASKVGAHINFENCLPFFYTYNHNLDSFIETVMNIPFDKIDVPVKEIVHYSRNNFGWKQNIERVLQLIDSLLHDSNE